MLQLRVNRLVRQLALGRLGDAEVNHLRQRAVVQHGHEHVGRLEVAVNDPLLVRVLHRLTDLHEQFQPLGHAHAIGVAVSRNRHPAHQFHHKVRPAGLRDAAVENHRDVRVIHQRERLALGFEARHYLACVHAQLDDFEGDAPADRFLLFGHPDITEAALADFLQQFVAADALAGLLAQSNDAAGNIDRFGRNACGRFFKKFAGLRVRLQEGFHALAEVGVAATLAVEERGAFDRGQPQRRGEDCLLAVGVGRHGRACYCFTRSCVK